MVNKIAALRDFRIHTCFSSLADDKKAQTSGESWAWRAGVLSRASGQWDSEFGPFSLVWARDRLGMSCCPLACPGSSNRSAGLSALSGSSFFFFFTFGCAEEMLKVGLECWKRDCQYNLLSSFA